MKKEVLFRKAFLLLFERLALAFSFVLNNKTRKTTAQAFSTWGLGAARYSTGKPALASGILLLLFSVGVQQSVFGQTASQNFGTGTGSYSSQTGSASLLPNPTGSGTTYARGGVTVPNAPIILANTSNPLGTEGSFIRAVASSSTSVSKVSPVVAYTGSTEFYTSCKVLFGDASGGNTAATGQWTLSQGAGAFFSDNNAYASSQTFAGLRFTYGSSGALTLTYDNNGTYGNSGLTANAFSQGVVYTIEIVGNNKASGTINYTYNGNAQTVAVQKYDLYINGTLVGNDLAKAQIGSNANISGLTFTGISSTNNAANLFIDDVVVYNAVPATIGAPLIAPPTLTAAANATVEASFDVTFVEDATWRAAISSITVGGTALPPGAYSTTEAGKITFTPPASTLLQSAGAKSIIVFAAGYNNATVTQTIGAGAASKLSMNTEPTAPTANGGALATQPKVNVTDQYGNVVTTSTATVTATVGAGGWVLGGTTAVNATSGVVTYSGLTATSVAALTGATIKFTSPGLTEVTSGSFNIIAPTNPVPVATAATNVNATSFTANWNAMPGATSYVIDVYAKTVQPNQTIASWTFPTTGTTLTADIFNSNNSGKLVSTNGGTISDSSGSTTQAPSANAWQSGSGTKYWQIEINTTGASQMKLSSVQKSSGTGPRDFKVQYKVGAGAWTDVTGATLTVGNDWTSGVLTNVTLPSACDNQSSVLIRWIMTSNIGVNGSAVTSGGTSRIDDIYIKGDFIANSYLVQNSNVGNVTSSTVTGLNPVSTYYYRVRAVNGATTSANSNEIQVITRPDTTSWDGNTWSNGAPALDINAVVNEALSMSTSLEAKSITVNSGGSVIVTTGKTLRVANEVNNATNDATKFIVESGASLIQNNAAVNAGPITVKRNSYPLYLLDYTLWASPVANQNLRNFSPNTLYNRFYSYNTTIAPNGNWVQEIVTTVDMNSKTFGLAKGYLIRMPNNWTPYSSSQTPGTEYQGVFVGVPNSGTITYTLSNANTGYNLVGNPYPSPISVASFRAANPGIGGTLYFYRKRNSAGGSGYGTLSQAGFAGNVSVNNFSLIEVGQGFFVKANGVSTLNFTNGMRAEASANAVFLRSSSAANTALTNDNPVEMNRFWLNLVKDNEQVGQALIGYIEGTTLGVDEDFDAKYFNDSALALTSIINNQEYIIQARPVPFVATDVVPLGFKTDVAGTYTFALGNKEGLFADATQNPIYLKDNTTNTLHHLNSGVYTFNSAAGVFNTRFEIWYEDNTLGNPSFGVDHNVNVYKQNKTIVVDAGTTKLEKIEIWDTLGRLLFTTSTSDTRFEVKQPLMENQVLLIKITTEKGSSNKKMHY